MGYIMKNPLKKKKQEKKPLAWLAPPTLIALTALVTYGWRKRSSLRTWKIERITNAYYDTLTQKDVAWG